MLENRCNKIQTKLKYIIIMSKKKILIIKHPNFKESWKQEILSLFKQAKFLFINDDKDLINPKKYDFYIK